MKDQGRDNAMKTRHIHVMGASGSGATSVGRGLADALALSHHDTDDYFWRPTTPPYREKRSIPDRLRLMAEMFLERSDWVLSGSLDGWGDPIVPLFDLVAFIYTPTAVRVQRLRAREAKHFGFDAVAPGGWRSQAMEEFVDWASHYDDGGREGRNLARHELWLASLPCRVLRLDGTRPLTNLVAEVSAALNG
jgi:adenylate kinase family enzyme